MPAEVDALVRYPAEANALNVRLRDVLVEVDALTRVCAVLLIVALAPHGGRKGQENYTASTRLDSWGYSSTSRHSKRADARFAKRTVYRPPSGELVMVLIR